jgi:hypothetical protein
MRRSIFPVHRLTMERIGQQNNQGDKNLILFSTEDALLEGTKAIVEIFFLGAVSLPRDNHETAAPHCTALHRTPPGLNPTLIDTLELFMPRGMCTWFSVRRGTANVKRPAIKLRRQTAAIATSPPI